MKFDHLARLGWNPVFEDYLLHHAEQGLVPARVLFISRDSCALACEKGELTGVLAGRFHAGEKPFPVVGDWVLARDTGDTVALVQDIVPRRNALSRKTPGTASSEQVMAANLDVMFIVQDVLRMNLPLVERYLALAGGSGILPLVVLNKCDLDDGADAIAREVSSRIPGARVILLSALTGNGLDEARGFLAPGKTACLLGPSGAGKSSIVNRLLGEERQAVAEVRGDDLKGRHTTTARELLFLPGGAMIIDTPGMRELMPWDGKALDASFADIAELGKGCRYRDCRHAGEPGCAVEKAVEEGVLDYPRLENYRRLRKEMAYLESRVDDGARQEKKRKDKELHRRIKRYNRERDSR